MTIISCPTILFPVSPLPPHPDLEPFKVTVAGDRTHLCKKNIKIQPRNAPRNKMEFLEFRKKTRATKISQYSAVGVRGISIPLHRFPESKALYQHYITRL